MAAMLAGCVTLTPDGPPPLVKRSGKAPKAALLPWYTNDHQLANTAYIQLKTCLEERNIFRFVPRDKVEYAIQHNGIDINKTFGISQSEAKQLADALEVDYILGGAFNVVKSLKLNGWRRDIASDMRIYRGSNGQKMHTLLSNTSMTFASAEQNADLMSRSAINHLCSQILQYSY